MYCMHVCMYVCICMYTGMSIRVYACTHVCMYACMYVLYICTSLLLYLIDFCYILQFYQEHTY